MYHLATIHFVSDRWMDRQTTVLCQWSIIQYNRLKLKVVVISVWCVLSVATPPESLDDEQAPRLYIVKRDATSGAELLRQSDVDNYLTDAQGDPDSVVLTEILPNCPGVSCITVLRRTTRSPSEMWLCPYTLETVVPPGLQISTTSMARRKVSLMTL